MRRFEWNPEKARTNVRDHKVSFEEAQLVFNDPFRLDQPNSQVGEEERWECIGLVRGIVVLTVVHMVIYEDLEDEVIRLISARKATRAEQRLYESTRESLR